MRLILGTALTLFAATMAVADPALLTDIQISLVKDEIVGILKDPESAKFGPMSGYEYKGRVIVCGMVNAKNSFGGYAGDMPFVGELYSGGFELQKLASTIPEATQVLVRCDNASRL